MLINIKSSINIRKTMSTWYSNDDLRRMILKRLEGEALLEGFKTKMSWKGLFRKDYLGWYEISIANSRPSVDLNRDSQFSLCVTPGYGRRFSVISKWFKDFLTDPRDETRWLTVSQGHKGTPYWVDFLRSGEGFDDDYKILRDIVLEESLPFFSKYMTIEDFYENDVKPGIEGKVDLRGDTDSWIFRWMMATRIADPDFYPIAKDKLIDWALNSPFPISSIFRAGYYKRLPEIISALESYDLSKERI